MTHIYICYVIHFINSLLHYHKSKIYPQISTCTVVVVVTNDHDFIYAQNLCEVGIVYLYDLA